MTACPGTDRTGKTGPENCLLDLATGKSLLTSTEKFHGACLCWGAGSGSWSHKSGVDSSEQGEQHRLSTGNLFQGQDDQHTDLPETEGLS